MTFMAALPRQPMTYADSQNLVSPGTALSDDARARLVSTCIDPFPFEVLHVLPLDGTADERASWHGYEVGHCNGEAPDGPFVEQKEEHRERYEEHHDGGACVLGLNEIVDERGRRSLANHAAHDTRRAA